MESVFAIDSATPVPDMTENIQEVLPTGFGDTTSKEQNPVVAQTTTTIALPDDASLISSYQPVSKNSITPIHRLLF